MKTTRENGALVANVQHSVNKRHEFRIGDKPFSVEWFECNAFFFFTSKSVQRLPQRFLFWFVYTAGVWRLLYQWLISIFWNKKIHSQESQFMMTVIYFQSAAVLVFYYASVVWISVIKFTNGFSIMPRKREEQRTRLAHANGIMSFSLHISREKKIIIINVIWNRFQLRHCWQR